MGYMNHDAPYSDDYIKDILSSVKTIAMVGASPDKTKFSYGVLRVLHETGYDIIPINPRPGLEEIRGLKVFPSLTAVDRPVDMVDVFRKPEDLPGVAREAVEIGAKVLWGQIGVVNHDAARLAEDAGMKVVMNRFQRERDMFLINPDFMEIRFLEPFQQQDLAVTGLSKKKQIWASYTLAVLNEAAHGVLADLNTSVL